MNSLTRNTRMLMLQLLLIMMASLPGWSAQVVPLPKVEHYNINVSLDPASHSLTGVTEIRYQELPQGKAKFILNREFEVVSFKLGGREYGLIKIDEYDPQEISTPYGTYGRWGSDQTALYVMEEPLPAKLAYERTATIQYTGNLYTPPDNRQFSREEIAFEVNGTIGEEGVYLAPSVWWYPRVPDYPASHTVEVTLPIGWNCVTVGDPVWTEENGQVRIEHTSLVPIDGINLSANKWEVKSIDHNGIKVMTYFLPTQAPLADDYLASCTGYLDMYIDMIAPYPFPKFAVVDNFLPSGYGMPGWTLLGSEVLRLPFIRFSSLGHEILHNWFGNSLYVDYRGGNWCEGLTAYLADHKYKFDRDRTLGMEYRRDILRDYTVYVSPENDYPLTKFVSRSDAHDRSIGYGKSTMVFHMLRRIILEHDPRKMNNPQQFDQFLNKIYTANQWQPTGWIEFEQEAEKVLNRDLTPWFDQWVRKPGAPEISIEDVLTIETEAGWEAHFYVRTDPETEHFQFPLTVRTINKAGEIRDENHFITEPAQGILVKGNGNLAQIQLDPEFEVFRKLYDGEMPVSLAAFFGEPRGVFVVPAEGPRVEQWRTVAEGLKKHGQQVVTDQELTPELMSQSLWLLQPATALFSMLFPEGVPHLQIVTENDSYAQLSLAGQEYNKGTETATIIVSHPQQSDKTVVCTFSLPAGDPVGGTRKLPHYGKYTYLVFDGDQNIGKGSLQSVGENGMVWEAGRN